MTHKSGAPFDDANIQGNLGLLAFEIMEVGSVAGIEKYIDFFADQFEDETGVDAAASADELYDAVNDKYGATVPADLCVGGTPLSSGDEAGMGVALGFDNNTGTRWGSVANISANVTYIGYHFLAAQTINYIRIWPNGSDYNPLNVHVQYSDDGASWTTLITKVHPTPGGAWSEIAFTNETESHAYWRMLAADSVAKHWYLYEIEMSRTTTGFVLISNSVEAESNDPATSKLLLLVDLNGQTITINTDLLGWISIDDGGNYESVSLVYEGLDGTGRSIFSGNCSPIARADKTMRAKIQVANGRVIYLKAWAVFWKY